MATYILVNTVWVGNTQYKSGKTVDSAVHNTTQIAGAGGVLVPTATYSTVVTAAAAVVEMWKVGKSQPECDAAMLSAYQAAVDAYGQGHDAVANTTATNQNSAAVDVGNSGAVATGSGNAVVTTSNTDIPRLFCAAKSLAAASVTVHAQDAGGGALNLTTAFTNPLPRRTLNIARSAAGPANVDYTCYYTMPDGTTGNTTITVASGGNTSTTIAGAWTRVTTTVDPVSTSNFTTGTGFCVGEIIKAASTPVLSCNGVVENATVHQASGTIVPTTAPDGTKGFAVAYLSTHLHAAADAGHTHAQTVHAHAQTVHSHTQNAHTHSLT